MYTHLAILLSSDDSFADDTMVRYKKQFFLWSFRETDDTEILGHKILRQLVFVRL